MTEAEFMRLPDDGRKYELVDGEPKVVPTSFEHDAIAVNLILRLGPYTRGRGFLTAGQAGFRMRDGNLRCPDVSFTRKERLPGGKPPRTFAAHAPDLAIEIISPSEDAADMQRNVQEYFASGAQAVWHLFPESAYVLVYSGPTSVTRLEADDEIAVESLLPGFRCRVAEIFENE